MPAQEFGERPRISAIRLPQFFPMQGIVIPTVLEFITDSLADFYSEVGCKRDVPPVQQTMEVGAEKHSIADVVGATLLEGADVSRFQDRERPLSGHFTAAFIGVRYDQPNEWGRCVKRIFLIF